MIYNIFGTDGIRNTVGKTPFTLEELPRLGVAIGRWLLQRYMDKTSVLIAHDTRVSAHFIKSGLTSGLLLYPIDVHDAYVLTTPAVIKIVSEDPRFHAGIIISASHNLYEDNGIKIITKEAGKLLLHDEMHISQFFYETMQPFDYKHVGTNTIMLDAETVYMSMLKRYFKAGFLEGKTIVLDCAHGAAYRIAPTIFRYYGAHVIELNTQPNGKNINQTCGALYPQGLQRSVLEYNANIGFAFDGDADRVIAVTHTGEIKDGDDILTILLQHPLYQQSRAIVGTILSNQGFEVFIRSHNKELLRSNVGDKYVAEKMIQHDVLLGGEQSGHIIARDFMCSGDGIFIALRILESLVISNNWDMVSFFKFPQFTINIPVATKRNLTDSPLQELIKTAESQLEKGRLVVRYSGTEPVLRIMIEDVDINHATLLGTYLSQQLQYELS